MTAVVTLWTFEDTSLTAATDAANIELTAVAEDGGTVRSVQVDRLIKYSDEDDVAVVWYLAQVVSQAGEVTP